MKDALESAFDGLVFFAIGFFVILPLAIWKLVDIIMWVVSHIKIV
jgi:hypothetical protein